MSAADQQEAGSGDGPSDTIDGAAKRRRYTAPRVLSAEPLEAAAATCDPPTAPLGKTVPIPCLTLGS